MMEEEEDDDFRNNKNFKNNKNFNNNKNNEDVSCFICQGNHYANICPNKGKKNGNISKKGPFNKNKKTN